MSLRNCTFLHGNRRVEISTAGSIVMRLLRKGEKCRLEATNYRPISLLSVFYKMVSGVMTRRLETVMEQVIGKQ